jgi:Phage integrase family
LSVAIGVVALPPQDCKELRSRFEEATALADRFEGAVESGRPGAVTITQEASVLGGDPAHVGPFDAGRERFSALIAGLDGLGDPEVLLSDGPVRDARVRVERTAYDVAGKLHIGPPKSDAGRRTVGVPSPALAALKGHLDARVGSEPSAPLLTGEKGDRLGRHPLNDAWTCARVAVGRPEVHFHDLRHAGLTWAATQGATTAELMRRAGHASPAAALRYQHATDDRDAALTAALSGPAQSAEVASISSGTRDIRAMKGRKLSASKAG